MLSGGVFHSTYAVLVGTVIRSQYKLGTNRSNYIGNSTGNSSGNNPIIMVALFVDQ